MHLIRLLLVCLLACSLLGCGGGTGTPGTGPVTVNISPNSQSLSINGTQQFSAVIVNNATATFIWRVQEGSAGGTISASGLYQAPATAGTYHVIANGGGGSGSAPVTVHPILTIAPSSPTVLAGAGNSQTFTAAVAGTSNQNVTWAVLETAGGSISASGVYTPPNAPGVYHIVATSVADNTVTGSSTVTVQGGNIQATIQ